MSLAVAVVEDEIVATARETGAAHPQAVFPGLHRRVVPAARLHQTARAHPRDVEDDRLQVTAQGLHHADRDVHPLRGASDEMADGINHGHQATTAGGCLGINHDLHPLK